MADARGATVQIKMKPTEEEINTLRDEMETYEILTVIYYFGLLAMGITTWVLVSI